MRYRQLGRTGLSVGEIGMGCEGLAGGEEHIREMFAAARAMGVNAPRLRFLTVVCATLVTAASIAVSGMIGWVGLVVPHLCRKLVGNNFRVLLPCSMLAGAAFLLLVDNLSRNLLATEIPIGILTAFVGAPFFLYLITRKKKL